MTHFVMYLSTQIEYCSKSAKLNTEIADSLIDQCMGKDDKLNRVKRFIVNVVKALT